MLTEKLSTQKVLPLFGILLSVQMLPNKTLAQEIKRDSIVPPENDAIALMQGVCGQNNVTQKNGEISCKTCPSFISDRGSNTPSLKSVVYGSFTQANTREALVDITDCNAQIYDGSVLLHRTDNGWSFVRYEEELFSDFCLKVPASKSRQALVCHASSMHQGYIAESLNLFDITSTKTTSNILLTVSSNTGSCKPPYFEVTIKDFSLQDTNKDGSQDLVVKVSEAREEKGTSTTNSDSCEPNFPESKIYEAIFLFNGQSFVPTPATVQLKNRWSSD